VAWQVRQVTNPARFPPQVFGIAVARFGEGESFRVTSRALDITDQIIRALKDTIRGNQDWDGVQVMPLGLVTNEDQARDMGNDVRADLVVWGQVVTVGQGTVSTHFEIIQTFDLASSPIFPLLLPAETTFAQNIAEVLDAPLEALEIKKQVSQQVQIIRAFSLGLAAYFNRDYGTAAAQFETVVRTLEAANGGAPSKEAKLGLIYFYLGRAHQQRGDLESGEAYLWEAAAFSPTDPAVPLGVAYGYNSMGRKEEAQRLARQAIEQATDWLDLHRDDVVVLYDRGLAYGLLDQPLRAAATFDDILGQEPTFYIAYLSAGLAYLEANEIELAIDRFQTAIQQAESNGTNSSWGYLFLAEAYNEKGDIKQAEVFYQRAVGLAPDVDWMHFRLGRFYESQSRSSEAEQAYRRMLEYARDEVWARAELAKFLRRQARLEEAIEEFQYVRRNRESDTLSKIFLAELFDETDQVERSREAFEDALACTPDLAYGHASYGRSLVKWGEYEAAVSHLKSAVTLDPSDCLSRFNLGRAYESKGQSQEALETFEAILSAPDELCSDETEQWAQERIDVLLAPTATPVPRSTPMPMPTPTGKATTTPMPTQTPTLLWQATPTGTPVPASTFTPMPTPTPIPTIAKPELLEPLPGATYKNPVTFEWSGSLAPGLAYQVIARHSESGYVIQSERLLAESWTADLPVERHGEWRWRVAVVSGESIEISSDEWMFWFDPFPKTPTLPPAPTPTPSLPPRPTRPSTPTPP
jgi:tetratricopeptide (TPR) repeat protein